MAKTKFSRALHREFEVAFSKHAQPVWFRVVKYIVIGVFVYFFWNRAWFWPVVLVFLGLSLALHFWYRYKTAGWRKSYGGWDFEKNRSKLED
jgi:uncharacterized membrane protein